MICIYNFIIMLLYMRNMMSIQDMQKIISIFSHKAIKEALQGKHPYNWNKLLATVYSFCNIPNCKV